MHFQNKITEKYRQSDYYHDYYRFMQNIHD